MNSVTISGTVISIRINKVKNQKTVANAFLCDYQSPKQTVYKISFWENDAAEISNEQVDTKDELCLEGMIYGVDTNEYGTYIEIRNCKLLEIIKVIKKRVFHTEAFEKTDEQSQETLEEGDPDE